MLYDHRDQPLPKSWFKKLWDGIASSTPQVKQALIAATVTIILAIVGGIASYWHVNMDNAQLRGVNSQQTQQIHNLENSLADVKANAIDAKRTAEAERNRLTTENASLQQRVTYVETLPQNVLTLVSNMQALQSIQPTNYLRFNALLEQLREDFTNSPYLNAIDKPALSLTLNGSPISEPFMYPLGTNRELTLQVSNSGNATRPHLTVIASFTLPGTNVNAPSWRAQPAITPNGSSFIVLDETPLANTQSFLAPPLTLRDVPSVSNELAIISVFSDTSPLQQFHVWLDFTAENSGHDATCVLDISVTNTVGIINFGATLWLGFLLPTAPDQGSVKLWRGLFKGHEFTHPIRQYTILLTNNFLLEAQSDTNKDSCEDTAFYIEYKNTEPIHAAQYRSLTVSNNMFFTDGQYLPLPFTNYNSPDRVKP
jgi:hypothetical protein